MNWSDIIAGSIVGLGALALVVVLTLAAPLFYALGGYVTGWVLASLFPFAGRWVIAGAGSLGIEISRDALPALGAFLGFVGAFFRAKQTNTNKCM